MKQRPRKTEPQPQPLPVTYMELAGRTEGATGAVLGAIEFILKGEESRFVVLINLQKVSQSSTDLEKFVSSGGQCKPTFATHCLRFWREDKYRGP